MARALLEKQARAIELRKLGWSYPAIKQELQVSKGSLSLWLHKYPLTGQQIREMNFDSQERIIEHFQEAFRRKRQQTLDEIYKREQKSLLPITDREMYVAGLMLYWGEGLKASWGRVSFSNTNPAMILFAIKWLTDCCGVPREKLQIRFHFYSDMDIEKEHQYWQNLLNLPRSQFRKPYIKQSLRTHINEKGGFGHGTCDITVGDTFLKEKIMMGIKVISDSLS